MKIYTGITIPLYIIILLGAIYVATKLLTGTRSQFALLIVFLTALAAIFIVAESSLEL